MADEVNMTFSRALMREAHLLVKENFPSVNLKRDAWVWSAWTDHWEFHGPGNFCWYGRAGNGFEARYKGWMAWLQNKGVALE